MQAFSSSIFVIKLNFWANITTSQEQQSFQSKPNRTTLQFTQEKHTTMSSKQPYDLASVLQINSSCCLMNAKNRHTYCTVCSFMFVWKPVCVVFFSWFIFLRTSSHECSTANWQLAPKLYFSMIWTHITPRPPTFTKNMNHFYLQASHFPEHHDL